MNKVELGKKRCRDVIERIQGLPASTNITSSSKRTLLKLVHSELTFLSRFSHDDDEDDDDAASTPTPLTLRVVPDNPSERMMSLPTTRKMALKNKVVFGTGDSWCAPTVTANMAFVRAISQTGMSLFTIEHRPRALTGD